MLYWLLYQKLFPYFGPFRIFRYLTFRTAFASLTALFMARIASSVNLDETGLTMLVNFDGFASGGSLENPSLARTLPDPSSE